MGGPSALLFAQADLVLFSGREQLSCVPPNGVPPNEGGLICPAPPSSLVTLSRIPLTPALCSTRGVLPT